MTEWLIIIPWTVIVVAVVEVVCRKSGNGERLHIAMIHLDQIIEELEGEE